jgi:hypothetical protein
VLKKAPIDVTAQKYEKRDEIKGESDEIKTKKFNTITTTVYVML